MRERLAAILARASPARFGLVAVAASFSAYFCMYAFRKPVGAATFDGQEIGGVELKIAVLTSQVLGYALSKIIGVKVISEMPAARRAVTLVGLILVAEAALVAFALLPPAGQLVAIFCNGLPLGAVWGLVYGFLEGRRTSEILGAGLSASYIVASGAVKSVGRGLVLAGVPEAAMPAVTGALFLAPFLVAVWVLSALPPPSAEDRAHRSTRAPMGAAARRAFFRTHAPGLLALTGLYMLLTAYRDVRDNFAVELWRDLGLGYKPELLTLSELPIALAVLAALALLVRVTDNRRALLWVHGLMAGGTALVGLATWGFDLGLLSGTAWMIGVGLGLYLAYVPYGCVLFDRMVAATRTVGTAVFMIYVTDAAGYVGSVAIMLEKNFGSPNLSWLDFFRTFSYVTALACTAAFAASAWFFARRTRPAP